MNACPSLPDLHGFADGALDSLPAAAIESHLPECGRCRDIVRALHRIDRYFDRAFSAAASAAEGGTSIRFAAFSAAASAAEGGISNRCSSAPCQTTAHLEPSFVHRPLRRPLLVGGAAAAAVLGCAILWPGFQNAGTTNRTASGTASVLASELAAADPGLDPDLPAAELWQRLPGGVPATPVVWPRLAEAWRSTEDIGVRLRLARLAAGAGCFDFRSRAEALALIDGLGASERRHTLLTVATFGGPESVRAIQRVAERVPAVPGDVAAALRATGEPSAARPLFEWHQRAGTDRDRVVLELAGLGGRPAAAILVREFLSGDESPALARVLGERPESRALLRRAAGGVGVSDRIRILRVLGQAGDPEAVPLIEAFLARGEVPETAAAALENLAHAGSDAALMALARAIPAADHPEAWSLAPRRGLFERIFASAPARTGTVLARIVVDPGSARRPAAERHGVLLALALCHSESSLPALSSALDRTPDRRVALSALAVLGRREAIPAVARHADAADRGVRRTAFAVLARLGGPDAAAILARSLSRTTDRRTIIGLVAAGEDRWALPVLIEGLRYDDAAAACHAALRRRAGSQKPTPADARWWRRHFGLGPGPGTP